MPSFFVQIEGTVGENPVTLWVVRGTRVFELTAQLTPDSPLRVLTQELSTQLRELALDHDIDSDYLGPLLVIYDVDDVALVSVDEELTAWEWEAEGRPLLNSETSGVLMLEDEEDEEDEEEGADDPDQEVLLHLANMVSSIARSSEAEERLMKTIASAQRTYVQASRALLIDGEIPPEPNPGGGGALEGTLNEKLGIIDGLGQGVPAMLDQAAELGEGRAEQLNAVAAKESEAKGGGGSGGAGATMVKGSDSKKSRVKTGGGAGGKGEAIEGAEGPDGGPKKKGPVARIAGSGEAFRPREDASEIIEIRAEGVELAAGHFDDGWYLAISRELMERVEVDGTRRTVFSYNFGDPHSDDPDTRPVPISKEKLDELIAKLESKPKEESEDPWKTVASVASFIADIAPILGNVKGAWEVFAGINPFTGEKLSTTEKAIGVIALLIPFAGPAVKTGLKALLKGSWTAVKTGAKLVAKQDDAISEFLAILSKRRQSLPNGKVPKKKPGVTTTKRNKAGRIGSRAGCFTAGTLVLLSNGDRIPIARLKVGDRVMARSDGYGAAMPRSVARVYERDMMRRTQLSFAGSDGGVVETTPRHPIGTPSGYRPAGELKRGDRVTRKDGTTAVVSDVCALRAHAPVFNLEVEEDHCYFVSSIDILVHNICESVTQREMMTRFKNTGARLETHPGTGRIIDEPAYSKGKALHFPRKGASSRAKAEALGIPTQGKTNKELQSLVKEKMKELRTEITYPDIVLHTDDGLIALELKAVKAEGTRGPRTVYDLLAQQAKGPIRKNSGMDLLGQAAQRKANMPANTQHSLVFDVRDAEGFRGVSAERQFEIALEDVQAAIDNIDLPYVHLNRHYSHVQFATRIDGKLVLSEMMEMPAKSVQ